MNIQFVRLGRDVCERLNQIARDQRRTVSEVANEMIRSQLTHLGLLEADGPASR